MLSDQKIIESDLLPLSDAEMELLYAIRHKWRHGKIEIDIRDGAPTFISRTIEREKLG